MKKTYCNKTQKSPRPRGNSPKIRNYNIFLKKRRGKMLLCGDLMIV